MKDDLNAVETYVRELRALKRYDAVDRLDQEVSELKVTLFEVQAERNKLKDEMLAKQNVEEEANQLKEALKQAQEEISILRETKAVLKGGELTLERAVREFLNCKETEIKARVEKESEELRKNFEAKVPQLVYERLIAVLEHPDWPPEIAQVIEGKAAERAQTKLDDEFCRRVNKVAENRLQQLKRTEWHSFVQNEVSRIGSNLVTLVAELEGTWHFICDRCHSMVTVDIGPGEVAVLLKGERVAECPQCRDFNLPPAPPFAPHKISGSSFEDLVVAYLAANGSLGKGSL